MHQADGLEAHRLPQVVHELRIGDPPPAQLRHAGLDSRPGGGGVAVALGVVDPVQQLAAGRHALDVHGEFVAAAGLDGHDGGTLPVGLFLGLGPFAFLLRRRGQQLGDGRVPVEAEHVRPHSHGQALVGGDEGEFAGHAAAGCVLDAEVGFADGVVDQFELAVDVQQLLTTEYFRPYTSDDVTGVELGGALKNVIGIAAGISDGLGFGDNAKSALITRGLAEITRLGRAMGARQSTFAGLSGIGDLITTCISPHGRNHRCGAEIGRGKTLKQVLESTEQVIEGVWTCRSVRKLAASHGVEIPICEQVYRVLFRRKSPANAVKDLMLRRPRPEED